MLFYEGDGVMNLYISWLSDRNDADSFPLSYRRWKTLPALDPLSRGDPNAPSAQVWLLLGASIAFKLVGIPDT
jgi:hypothetical protein